MLNEPGITTLLASLIVTPEFCINFPVVRSNLAIALSVEEEGPTTSPDPPPPPPELIIVSVVFS